MGISVKSVGMVSLVMKKVCLIGSFRFYREMLEVKEILESSGLKCFAPVPSKWRDPNDPSKFLANLPPEEELIKDAYQAVLTCFKKIDDCDLIYIINKGGYVGKNTLIDIGYAFARNKPIYALEPIDDLAVMSLVKAVISPIQLVELLKGT